MNSQIWKTEVCPFKQNACWNGLEKRIVRYFYFITSCFMYLFFLDICSIACQVFFKRYIRITTDGKSSGKFIYILFLCSSLCCVNVTLINTKIIIPWCKPYVCKYFHIVYVSKLCVTSLITHVTCTQYIWYTLSWCYLETFKTASGLIVEVLYRPPSSTGHTENSHPNCGILLMWIK